MCSILDGNRKQSPPSVDTSQTPIPEETEDNASRLMGTLDINQHSSKAEESQKVDGLGYEIEKFADLMKNLVQQPGFEFLRKKSQLIDKAAITDDKINTADKRERWLYDVMMENWSKKDGESESFHEVVGKYEEGVFSIKTKKVSSTQGNCESSSSQEDNKARTKRLLQQSDTTTDKIRVMGSVGSGKLPDENNMHDIKIPWETVDEDKTSRKRSGCVKSQNKLDKSTEELVRSGSLVDITKAQIDTAKNSDSNNVHGDIISGERVTRNFKDEKPMYTDITHTIKDSNNGVHENVYVSHPVHNCKAQTKYSGDKRDSFKFTTTEDVNPMEHTIQNNGHGQADFHIEDVSNSDATAKDAIHTAKQETSENFNHGVKDDPTQVVYKVRNKASDHDVFESQNLYVQTDEQISNEKRDKMFPRSESVFGITPKTSQAKNREKTSEQRRHNEMFTKHLDDRTSLEENNQVTRDNLIQKDTSSKYYLPNSNDKESKLPDVTVEKSGKKQL